MSGDTGGIRARPLPAEPPAAFPPPNRPLDGAPNVLVIVLDDTGFAQLGAFGADVRTPNIDRLAAGGLRYNRFHVTAICSATRATVLTGRNHHSVGVGLLTDFPLAYPGYRGKIPRSAATMPRLLRDAGYSTYAVGKWHLAPRFERTAAGPFDAWPLGLGFERYYGFLHGLTNQWTPNLVQDNHYIEAPVSADGRYHLTEDLSDQAIRLLKDQQHAAPGKPFFLYYALGAMHSPHHVGPEWVEPYIGKFDRGWDELRPEVFERQLAAGIVPPGTKLTERPPWVAAWSELGADARRMFARQQEVFAGFLSHTDAQIGRILDHLEVTGQLDNTLVMLLSDNGASAEGGVQGSDNELRFSMQIRDSLENNLSHYHEWGSPRTYNHYSWAWAWLGNTPFRLWKRYTWLGGTRTPLIVHWPARIAAQGEIRQAFAHSVDLLPTVLDAVGVEAPAQVDGVAQQPIDGASLTHTFDDPNAESRRATQYFEMLGSRSIVHGHWKATTNHVQGDVIDERELLPGSRAFENDEWSLFDLSKDFSEAHDLARERPEMVELLERVWIDEALRNHVLPLSDHLLVRDPAAIIGPTWPIGPDRTYLPGAGAIPDEVLPSIASGFSFTVDTDVDSEPDGVLFAIGDWNGGLALFVADARPHLAWSRAGELLELSGTDPLPAGRLTIGASCMPRAEGGELTLVVSGEAVDQLEFDGPVSVSGHFAGAQLRIGRDWGLPVSERYTVPGPWNGTIHSVRLRVPEPAPASPGERLREAIQAD